MCYVWSGISIQFIENCKCKFRAVIGVPKTSKFFYGTHIFRDFIEVKLFIVCMNMVTCRFHLKGHKRIRLSQSSMQREQKAMFTLNHSRYLNPFSAIL